MLGRQTETALAALSRLAEVYDGGRTRLSAGDIARDRDLQGPFVAKILTTLASAGIVAGTRGPGGGYSLTRTPASIRLLDVSLIFQKNESGAGDDLARAAGAALPDRLRRRVATLNAALNDLLRNTTLDELKRDRGSKRSRVHAASRN